MEPDVSDTNNVVEKDGMFEETIADLKQNKARSKYLQKLEGIYWCYYKKILLLNDWMKNVNS